jgi:hypothetical protein
MFDLLHIINFYQLCQSEFYRNLTITSVVRKVLRFVREVVLSH